MNNTLLSFCVAAQLRLWEFYITDECLGVFFIIQHWSSHKQIHADDISDM